MKIILLLLSKQRAQLRLMATFCTTALAWITLFNLPFSHGIFAMAIVLFTVHEKAAQTCFEAWQAMNYRLPDEHLMMYTTQR